MAKRGHLERRRTQYNRDGSVARVTYVFHEFDPADVPDIEYACEVFDNLLQVQDLSLNKQWLTKVRIQGVWRSAL